MGCIGLNSSSGLISQAGRFRFVNGAPFPVRVIFRDNITIPRETVLTLASNPRRTHISFEFPNIVGFDMSDLQKAEYTGDTVMRILEGGGISQGPKQVINSTSQDVPITSTEILEIQKESVVYFKTDPTRRVSVIQPSGYVQNLGIIPPGTGVYVDRTGIAYQILY